MFGGWFGVFLTDSEFRLRNILADFLLNKSVLARRKKGFYTNCPPKNEEIGDNLYLAAQNFKLFSIIQKSK
jgi:hypothetical protein